MFGKCTLPRWSVQSELPSFIIIFCHSLSVFSIKIKHFPYFFFVIEWVPDNLILFIFPWDGDLTIFYRHLLDGCPWQLYEFIAILVIECHTIVPVNDHTHHFHSIAARNQAHHCDHKEPDTVSQPAGNPASIAHRMQKTANGSIRYLTVMPL